VATPILLYTSPNTDRGQQIVLGVIGGAGNIQAAMTMKPRTFINALRGRGYQSRRPCST
jgi:hypothetical protein